jgi:hypothetical protein
MTRLVLYLAHPLGGDVPGNIARAQRWLTWLRRSFPETTFVAPWISAVLSGEDDNDPAQREAGLVDACAVIELLHGAVLCGGRMSVGMARERGHARRVFDLTSLGEAPTGALYWPISFVEWAGALEAVP